MGLGSTTPALFFSNQTIQSLPVLTANAPFVPYGAARDASADGNVIVGQVSGSWVGGGFGRISQNGVVAARWTTAGVEALGDMGTQSQPVQFCSRALASSTDGKTIVGYGSNPSAEPAKFGDIAPDTPGIPSGFDSLGGSNAFIWHDGQGMTLLDDPFPGDAISLSKATDVSRDGNTVVGYTQVASNSLEVAAARWTQADGWFRLGPDHSLASAISGDGSTIVGGVIGGGAAFRYTDPAGLELLSDVQIQGSSLGWRPTAVDADGRVILGTCFSNDGTAVIWDAIHGTRDLADALQSDYGLVAPADSLLRPVGISDDGNVLVGQNWIVVLPEPSFASFLAVGLLFSSRQRRTGRAVHATEAV